MFVNTTRNMSLRKKIQPSDSNFEFTGEWLIGIGWVMSITTDVVFEFLVTD